MKIVVSPTKTMKRKSYKTKTENLQFDKESKELRELLVSKTKDELKVLFKASDRIVDQNYEALHNPKEPIAAINLYEGAAFKAMKIDEMSSDDLDFFNDHVYICSAMYGLLKPYANIQEYRLDYSMPFEVNLYDFWKPKLTEIFKEEELIVNLASKEFSTSFQHDNVLHIHFLDEKERNLSTQAKQGRGDMLNYIIKHRVQVPEALKEYRGLNYQFDEVRSDRNNYYFIKRRVNEAN